MLPGKDDWCEIPSTNPLSCHPLLNTDLPAISDWSKQTSKTNYTTFKLPHAEAVQEMASPTSGSHPYSYQNASAMATRSLVSPQKPTETPSASSSSSCCDHGNEKPGVLKRQTTHHYEQALALSQQSASDEADGSSLDRGQNSSKDDYKRELMKQSLANAPGTGGRGYDSTAAH
ncbi:hypothetical protein SMMN14_01867 [Sphaerulina musiva]